MSTDTALDALFGATAFFVSAAIMPTEEEVRQREMMALGVGELRGELSALKERVKHTEDFMGDRFRELGGQMKDLGVQFADMAKQINQTAGASKQMWAYITIGAAMCSGVMVELLRHFFH